MIRFATPALLAAALSVLLASGEASAQPAVKCTVFEVKASNDGEGPGVDPQLKKLEKKLKKPPFSSWKTFKLLKKHTKTAEQMKPLTLKLVPGWKLGLLYRSASTSKRKKTRLRLTITIDDKTGKRKAETSMNVDEGQFNLIWGGEILGEGSYYFLASACDI
jgi:hypothetical protein